MGCAAWTASSNNAATASFLMIGLLSLFLACGLRVCARFRRLDIGGRHVFGDGAAIRQRVHVALARREREPDVRLHRILGDAAAVLVHAPEVELRDTHALLGSFAKPR